MQCLSGTGSLRAGAEFLARILGLKTAYFSNPTWYGVEISSSSRTVLNRLNFRGNHRLVFNNAGFTTFNSYQYWDAVKRCVSIDKILADLEAAPEK